MYTNEKPRQKNHEKSERQLSKLFINVQWP